MSDTSDPFRERSTRDFILPEHLVEFRGRGDFALPEHDLEQIEGRAPEGWPPSSGSLYRLDQSGYDESDNRVPTQADRDRAMREALGIHRAYTISDQIGSGTSAEAILAAEQARLMRGAGQLPDQTDPMGPELDTPKL